MMYLGKIPVEKGKRKGNGKGMVKKIERAK